ncbi:MAG: superoxide dismutase family protein [Myxococcales bacterium]|nr:superoxide dismutase family protein [Myxococcales bacterium]
MTMAASGILLGTLGCNSNKDANDTQLEKGLETLAQNKFEEGSDQGAAAPSQGQPPDPTPGNSQGIASAAMEPTRGNSAKGTVVFTKTDEGVRVVARLGGLEPRSAHGFHVHEKGDCSAPDATSAGGHYNPNDHDHALPTQKERHMGDMGNLMANGEGIVAFEHTFENLSLEGEHSIINRAVIVHEKRDKGTEPTGDAGSRIACGVIQSGEPS